MLSLAQLKHILLKKGAVAGLPCCYFWNQVCIPYCINFYCCAIVVRNKKHFRTYVNCLGMSGHNIMLVLLISHTGEVSQEYQLWCFHLFWYVFINKWQLFVKCVEIASLSCINVSWKYKILRRKSFSGGPLALGRYNCHCWDWHWRLWDKSISPVI